MGSTHNNAIKRNRLDKIHTHTHTHLDESGTGIDGAGCRRKVPNGMKFAGVCNLKVQGCCWKHYSCLFYRIVERNVKKEEGEV